MDAIARKRVLIAEDDARSARRLAQILREDGYDVEVVHDGAAAMERVAQGAHDVVVADYRLPGADGLAVLRRARARVPKPRLVMLTSYLEVVERLLGDADGDIHVLSKPVSYEELERLLARTTCTT
jgi:CheY-like chemotaxis protein